MDSPRTHSLPIWSSLLNNDDDYDLFRCQLIDNIDNLSLLVCFAVLLSVRNTFRSVIDSVYNVSFLVLFLTLLSLPIDTIIGPV